MKLSEIVPWGRNLNEYTRMFALTPADLRRAILDCGGGPASFNSELTDAGGRVVSCDPLYAFSESEIRQRIQETAPKILSGLSGSLDHFVWSDIRTPEDLARRRFAAMDRFLQDYGRGRAERRYLAEALPVLPFAAKQFGLALCSHLLFTYSDHLSLEFHASAIREMCRVAEDVRIFPLLKLNGGPSPHLPPVLDKLHAAGLAACVVPVAYEFQKGGNQMLRIAC